MIGHWWATAVPADAELAGGGGGSQRGGAASGGRMTPLNILYALDTAGQNQATCSSKALSYNTLMCVCVCVCVRVLDRQWSVVSLRAGRFRAGRGSPGLGSVQDCSQGNVMQLNGRAERLRWTAWFSVTKERTALWGASRKERNASITSIRPYGGTPNTKACSRTQ